MNPNELDPFTEALRLDLPSADDGRRVKARLVSAGLFAGAGVALPGAALATSGGLLAKLGALPIAAKIGASAVVVGVVAVPVLGRSPREDENDRARTSNAQVATVTRSKAAPAPAPTRPELRPDETLPSPANEPAPEPAPPTMRSAPARPGVAAALPPETPTPSPGPAVGSFPVVVDAPVDEGTLRAETALMERALAAIRRDDFATARSLLAAHAAQYPNGHLKRERERALERTMSKETER